MIQALNIEESLDPIKLFFFSDFQTKEFKQFTRGKIKSLSPYQYYHLLEWLLKNLKDDVLLGNLDLLFDFSTLNPKKYLPSNKQSLPVDLDTTEKSILPNSFYEDCRSFFHSDYVTMNSILEEMASPERMDRFLFYFRAKKDIRQPKINFERLLHIMSLEERLCFPVHSFPDQEEIPFYGHALNYLKQCFFDEAKWLGHSLSDEIRKEGTQIKKLFISAGKEALPFAIMDRSVILWPVLVDFEKWKQLVRNALKQKGLFGLLKRKLLMSLKELEALLGEEYFQDLTIDAYKRSFVVKDKETGINTIKSFSPPLVHSSQFSTWLKKLKARDLKISLKVEAEESPKNQIIISKKGSQLKLKKALAEFFNHLKIRVDEERGRAIESFLYRNFSFEYDEKIDFTKRTVSNFGHKPLSFIPSKHAKDFAKLFLYLADKKYILSNKTQIIRTLDDDIHEKNGKDGFSYSSLIRIPSDEHHLFPDKDIRRRIRSILKIDD